MTIETFLLFVQIIRPFEGKAIQFTLSEFAEAFPDIPIEEVAEAIVDMRDAEITNTEFGGITVPAKYFEASLDTRAQ